MAFRLQTHPRGWSRETPTRPPGNGEWEADDLSSCAGQLSAEMQLLQEPSAGPEAKDAEAAARRWASDI